jgi:hypothetical protein
MFWFPADKEICYHYLLQIRLIAVQKRTGIHESGQPLGDPECITLGYFIGGGPLGDFWVIPKFGR